MLLCGYVAMWLSGPLTPQHTDSHPCTRQGWSRSLLGGPQFPEFLILELDGRIPILFGTFCGTSKISTKCGHLPFLIYNQIIFNDCRTARARNNRTVYGLQDH